MAEFGKTIGDAYAFQGEWLDLGRGVHDGKVVLRGPLARMVPADDVDGAAKASPLYAKYGTKTDRESAPELLAARMEQAAEPEPEADAAPAPRRRRAESAERGDPLTDFLGSAHGKRLQREVVRGMFGLLRKRL